MNLSRIALGTLAYTIVTFPIAVIWHVVLFKAHYAAFGYFTGEPSFLLGFLTIVIQGAILSALFPLVKLSGSPIGRGMKFSAIVGTFFWTSHVLAFVAKQAMQDAPLFVAMETGYLAIQFGVFGVLIGLVYKGLPREA
jgi:hypothetical protein